MHAYTLQVKHGMLHCNLLHLIALQRRVCRMASQRSVYQQSGEGRTMLKAELKVERCFWWRHAA